MGYTRLGCSGLFVPDRFLWAAMSPSINSATVDATGEKLAWCGPFWHPSGPGTYNIRRVGFLFGTVTKAGGSAMTVSLQDISTAAGVPYQPDETQDQTVAIANADSGFVTNGWYRSGTLSADRSIAFGAQLACVIEFDGGGRLGADAVNLRNLTGAAANVDNQNSVALKSGAGPTWGVTTVAPNIVFECDDGSFGSFLGGWPFSAIGNIALDSSDTPDEVANAFTVPVACKVDAVHFCANANNPAANFDVVLYNGTTVLDTVSVNGTALNTNTGQRQNTRPLSTEIELLTGNTYYLSVKPTTTNNNNVRVEYRDVNSASHLVFGGLFNSSYAQRTDGGAWGGTIATRQLMMGLRICSISDGSGGAPFAPMTHDEIPGYMVI